MSCRDGSNESRGTFLVSHSGFFSSLSRCPGQRFFTFHAVYSCSRVDAKNIRSTAKRQKGRFFIIVSENKELNPMAKAMRNLPTPTHF